MEKRPKSQQIEAPSFSKSIRNALERVHQEESLDIDVRAADPLEADSFFKDSLPQLNKKDSSEEVIKQIRILIPDAEKIEVYTLVEARAALRDLGHIAASLRKKNTAISKVPELEDALLAIGLKINEVPRDTVFSYGPRNPLDERERTFTGLEAEKLFIRSFREGMSELYAGVDALISAYEAGPESEIWERECRKATTAFERMVEAIRSIRKNLPPETFTYELRPYFDPIELEGKTYYAPGGAQMPVLLYDQLLWGSDSNDESYKAYKEDNIAYSPPAVRELSASLDGAPSMLTKLLNASNGGDPEQTRKSAAALLQLSNSLLRFRAPHQKVAADNFALRSEHSLGSGGYTPEILQRLSDHVQEVRAQIVQLAN
ncbi:MAG: monodechloroaminopyrrolnitrin synthase PrnB family protein [Patescibacteria group bacterium]